SKVEEAFGDCKNGAGSAAEQIRKAGGYEQVIGFDYNWTKGLAANGKNLADFLNSLKAAGLVTVDLEGHSEGVPVLLSAACQTHVTLGNVAMLGGPIMGTPAASVASALQGGINALETVLLNLYGASAPPVLTLGGILNGQFAPDLQPGNTGTLAAIRGCVASKMTDSTSNLGNTKLIAAAGYDSENELRIGVLGTVFKFFGLFGSEPFDGIVGLYSALGVGSGLNITRLSPYGLSHTRLECDSNVIRDVGRQVSGSGGCAYTISPTNQSFGASGETSSSVVVAAASGCKWTAVSNANWITITSGSSGNGDGTVNYSVDANPGTSPRTGAMTIAGLTFAVIQGSSLCSFSIDPTSQSFGVSGGPGSVNVTAPSGCAWTAAVSSGNNWITITSGSGGSGTDTVNYSVEANPGTTQRTGSITIAGLAFAVIQGSGLCSFSIDPTSQPFGASGGPGSVNVTAPSGCAWTAAVSSGNNWITITSVSSPRGNGTVNYSVEVNPGTTQRTGSITIAGLAFAVIQAGNTASGYYYANWDCHNQSQCIDVIGHNVGSAGPFCSSAACTTWRNTYFFGATCDAQPLYPIYYPPASGTCIN